MLVHVHMRGVRARQSQTACSSPEKAAIASHVNEQGERSWTFPHIEDAYATGDLGKAQGTVDLLGQTIYDAVRALEF